jgi:hypothetical protein
MKNKILAFILSIISIVLVLGYFYLVFSINELCYLHIILCFIVIIYFIYKIWLGKLNKK